MRERARRSALHSSRANVHAQMFRVLALRLALLWNAHSEAVQVDDHLLDTSLKDVYAIQDDEWEWEKLPGRCCYDIHRPSCSDCKYFGNPDDFCHQSREHCTDNCSPHNDPDAVGTDGSALAEPDPLTYCDGAPPPLVDGGKVCVGASRLSAPCVDRLNTGNCQGFGQAMCQMHCWWTPGCAMFVVYSVLDAGDNMDGSCVLCYDMHWSEPTTNYHSRVFRYTPNPTAKFPPAPPSQPGPKPPPLPPSPSPPPLPDLVLPLGGEDLASCTFQAPYELVYASASGSASTPETSSALGSAVSAMAAASVGRAPNATSCCATCAAETACVAFVFEESSGACVRLPAADGEKLEPRYNPGMTAGFLHRYTQGSLSPPSPPVPARCTYEHDRGFSSGGDESSITVATPPQGLPSPEACCSVCTSTAECVKFSFMPRPHSPGLGDCLFFKSIAEPFNKVGVGMVAGIVDAKDVSFTSTPLDALTSSPPPPPQFPMLGLIDKASPASAAAASIPAGLVVAAGFALLGASVALLCVVRALRKPSTKRVAAFERIPAKEDAVMGDREATQGARGEGVEVHKEVRACLSLPFTATPSRHVKRAAAETASAVQAAEVEAKECHQTEAESDEELFDEEEAFERPAIDDEGEEFCVEPQAERVTPTEEELNRYTGCD